MSGSNATATGIGGTGAPRRRGHPFRTINAHIRAIATPRGINSSPCVIATIIFGRANPRTAGCGVPRRRRRETPVAARPSLSDRRCHGPNRARASRHHHRIIARGRRTSSPPHQPINRSAANVAACHHHPTDERQLAFPARHHASGRHRRAMPTCPDHDAMVRIDRRPEPVRAVQPTPGAPHRTIRVRNEAIPVFGRSHHRSLTHRERRSPPTDHGSVGLCLVRIPTGITSALTDPRLPEEESYRVTALSVADEPMSENTDFTLGGLES